MCSIGAHALALVQSTEALGLQKDLLARATENPKKQGTVGVLRSKILTKQA